ncbi:hypothetical protein NGM99_19865 [Mesorhizobium sp. RP14(2022)]|uniref:Transmembrane protein PGPGW n=1 Tax=Mesorhizobium liriopis TaxID=2953882 RepID=A0ABT1CB47_9HYPH|nr:hypothetical protein [Mesorhizobium liriopis]MCO6052047.1 hypothetical protein [Mesorhizobium liriopis]
MTRAHDPADTSYDKRESIEPPRRKITLLGRDFYLPRSRWARIALGSALVIGGCLGFLPILGFWMVPVGLLVLSYEFASVRRWRRRTAVWWHRRRRPSARRDAPGAARKAA